MTYVQVKSPNLNVPAELGMCLAYVQTAFGLGWTGSYALDGWNRNKANHADRSIPSGVYLPVWFTGLWDGFNYGHVVIYKDGVCFSSPYTNKGSHDQLGNIETVERIYGMKYLGWSEDMNGQRVIKKKEDEMTAAEQEKYKIGVAFSKLKRLSEGTLRIKAKLPKTQVWRLETEPEWKSGFTYKKGDEFEVVAYVDTNDTRYYVSAPDALNGKPWGVNRKDIEILGPVKPAKPSEFEELKQTVYVKKK